MRDRVEVKRPPSDGRTGARRARAVGYKGKRGLHPAQIDLLGDLFAPSAEGLARALTSYADSRPR
jgi:citrate lyase beta subunit